jgi:hypothetical protein
VLAGHLRPQRLDGGRVAESVQDDVGAAGSQRIGDPQTDAAGRCGRKELKSRSLPGLHNTGQWLWRRQYARFMTQQLRDVPRMPWPAGTWEQIAYDLLTNARVSGAS